MFASLLLVLICKVLVCHRCQYTLQVNAKQCTHILEKCTTLGHITNLCCTFIHIGVMMQKNVCYPILLCNSLIFHYTAVISKSSVHSFCKAVYTYFGEVYNPRTHNQFVLHVHAHKCEDAEKCLVVPSHFIRQFPSISLHCSC